MGHCWAVMYLALGKIGMELIEVHLSMLMDESERQDERGEREEMEKHLIILIVVRKGLSERGEMDSSLRHLSRKMCLICLDVMPLIFCRFGFLDRLILFRNLHVFRKSTFISCV